MENKKTMKKGELEILDEKLFKNDKTIRSLSRGSKISNRSSNSSQNSITMNSFTVRKHSSSSYEKHKTNKIINYILDRDPYL